VQHVISIPPNTALAPSEFFSEEAPQINTSESPRAQLTPPLS